KTHCLCASVPLDRNHWPSITRRHDQFLDRGLKHVIEGGDDPVMVLCSCNEFSGYRIAGAPQLYGITVNHLASTQDFGAWISGVAMSPEDLQDCSASGLIITMQNMLPKRNTCSSFVEWYSLMHQGPHVDRQSLGVLRRQIRRAVDL